MKTFHISFNVRCTYDRTRSGLPSVNFESKADVFVADTMHIARCLTRSLEVPKTAALKNLHTALLLLTNRRQSGQLLQSGKRLTKFEICKLFWNLI